MKRKKLLAALTAMLSVMTVTTSLPVPVHAENPIVQTSFTPDPAPVVFGDELYVFTGCDRDADNSFYKMIGWQCFSTKDMKNWTDHGMILKDNEFSWCNAEDAWASQCIERNGKYYFYFTTTVGGRGRAIGVGVADKPEGPYKDVLGKPLCGPDWAYIDPTVMIDDDGQAWLMFGNPNCYYVKLKEDMVTLDGEIKTFNLQLKSGTKYTEGPWIYKHDNLYYLVFASMVDGFGGESISYCTGPTITGPWTHQGTIHEGSNCFTTHGGIIDYKGHSYSFYHMNGLYGGGPYKRSAACEEFTYNPDGTIPALKSTKEGPSQIEYLNPYERVEAETGSWMSGIKTEKIDAGTLAIGFIENGDYVKVSGVDFGQAGASEFTASVASNGQGGKIELHLDSETGPMVGTVTVPVTGDWQNWEQVSGNVVGATGVHDLYLRFAGGDSYLFNVDWWQFSSAEVDETPFGDINKDGKINGVDLTLAKKAAMTSPTSKSKADVDKNNVVDSADVNWYVDFLTAQKTEYPEKAESPVKQYNYNSGLQFHEFPSKYLEQSSNPGKVIKEQYEGPKGTNTCYVYLPPNYDENKKYNIFYLMHGGGEDETTMFFSKDTQMQNIFDHMIEKGDMEPMIVVAPTWNQVGAENFWQELRERVIPHVEGKYSTYAESTSLADIQASRYHRAYGGFSMGSISTWGVFMHDLDIIAYYMPLSGEYKVNNLSVQQQSQMIINSIHESGLKPNEYFIMAATGSDDMAQPNMTPLINELRKNTNELIETSDLSKGNFYYMMADGKVHWWQHVRHYVYDILPYFFHEGKSKTS